jgi:hypothetical protein
MRSIQSLCVSLLLTALVAIGVVLSGAAHAQSTTAVTATCKDGSSYSGKSKRGACAHHGGVKAFAVAAGAENSTPQASQSDQTAVPPVSAKKAKIARTASRMAPATTPTVAQTVPPTAPAGTPKIAQTAPPAAAVQAPGSNRTAAAGQVWVNTASKVYHCPGTRYHGNTKTGEYMSEAAAKAQGFRPSRGKECT